MWSEKFLHLSCCVLSSRGRKGERLHQLPTTCRKEILGTSGHGTCRAQRSACCGTGSIAETLAGYFGCPEKIMTLWRLNCLIQSKGRNRNFSVSRSCAFSGEAGELMLLALMSSGLLKLSGSPCTQAILHLA